MCECDGPILNNKTGLSKFVTVAITAVASKESDGWFDFRPRWLLALPRAC